MNHSLLLLETRPWIFFIELFRWLIWGTGMLLAPVVQLAIFASSSALLNPSKEGKGDGNTIPDIEILPVCSAFSNPIFSLLLTTCY